MKNISINKKTAKSLIEIFEYMQHGVFDARWHEEQKVVDELMPILKKIKC